MDQADYLITSLLNERMSLPSFGRKPKAALGQSKPDTKPPAAARPDLGAQQAPDQGSPLRDVDSGGGHRVITGVPSEKPQPTYRPARTKIDRFRDPRTRMSHPMGTTRRNYGKKHGVKIWRLKSRN